MGEATKKGRRHSARDAQLIQQVKASASDIVEAAVALGADEEEVREAVADGAEGKALSLEDIAEKVRRAFYRQFASEDDDWAGPYLMEVYEAYGIASLDGEKYRVAYEMTADGITFTPREAWELVEKDWVPASVGAAAPLKDASTVVAWGEAVKALGDGRVGGYLVRFSTEADPDLTGEWFTAKTYYGPRDGDGADTLVHHGFPLKAGLEELADRLLSPLKTTKDEIGIFAEVVLDMADEYEKMLYELVEAGKLGWSSGAPGHMVRCKDSGEITRWPIAEGSLTPTPAEPRNRVVSLKMSVTPLLSVAEDANEATKAEARATGPQVEVVDNQEGEKMGDEVKVETVESPGVDVAALVESAVTKALAQFQAGLEAEPALKTPGYAAPGLVLRRSDEKLTAEKAFKAYLHRGEQSDAAIKATLNETTDGQGGYAVPTQFANEIVLPLADASILRAAGARVIALTGTDSFRLPSLTFSAAAVLKAESAGYSQSEPTMGEVEFNPYKYTKLSKVTEELVADSRFDVWGQILQPDWTQAFAAAENGAFTTGTGTGQPQGVVVGSALGVTAASATAITADEVIDLVHSVGYLYRSRAKFMMHDTTLRELRQLKDGEGRYLWSIDGGLNGSPTGSLLGYPVITNNSMAEIATGNKTVLFGDFSYYVVADWAGVGMQRLDELYAGTGEVGFRGYRRLDGNVILSAAIKHLIQA